MEKTILIQITVSFTNLTEYVIRKIEKRKLLGIYAYSPHGYLPNPVRNSTVAGS